MHVRYLPRTRHRFPRLAGKKRPTVTVTVRQLAEWVRGRSPRRRRPAHLDARTLAEAEPGDITFVEHDRHLAAWHASRASAAIVPSASRSTAARSSASPTRSWRSSESSSNSAVARSMPDRRISPTARDPPDASSSVPESPSAVRGGRRRDRDRRDNCTLHAGRRWSAGTASSAATSRSTLTWSSTTTASSGNRVTIHANAVIGADGFGYRIQDGRHVKVPQLGWVEIEDDVEIGACTTIDRGTFGPTRIGAGTKIDNLVMIGHNCQIGRHNVLCSQVGIAGLVHDRRLRRDGRAGRRRGPHHDRRPGDDRRQERSRGQRPGELAGPRVTRPRRTRSKCG